MKGGVVCMAEDREEKERKQREEDMDIDDNF